MCLVCGAGVIFNIFCFRFKVKRYFRVLIHIVVRILRQNDFSINPATAAVTLFADGRMLGYFFFFIIVFVPPFGTRHSLGNYPPPPNSSDDQAFY